MSFQTVKNNTSSRFNEVQVFLNYITSQEPNAPLVPTPLEVKIMRGLFYVHLYSSLEKSFNELVQHTLALINSKNVKNIHYTLSFNTISVIDKLKSLKDCSHKKFISKSIDIFEEVGTRNSRNINETMFSTYLQNVWVETILEIQGAFGMPIMSIAPRTRYTINEIVDKRNAVAHGRDSAAVIGERYRCSDLRIKLDITQDFIIGIIDEFENYYVDKKYLKPVMKKHYV